MSVAAEPRSTNPLAPPRRRFPRTLFAGDAGGVRCSAGFITDLCVRRSRRLARWLWKVCVYAAMVWLAHDGLPVARRRAAFRKPQHHLRAASRWFPAPAAACYCQRRRSRVFFLFLLIRRATAAKPHYTPPVSCRRSPRERGRRVCRLRRGAARRPDAEPALLLAVCTFARFRVELLLEQRRRRPPRA